MARIEKRKSRDGAIAYRAQIRLKGHKPKSATFERLGDAREWVQKEEADIKRGLKFDDHHAQSHTLAEAITEYEAYPDHRMKDRQFDQRKKHLAWWKERLGANYLADINADKLNACKRQLMAREATNQPVKGRIKAATIHNYLNALSALLNFTKRELNWIRHNPMQEITKPKMPKGRVRYLTKEEREALMTACQVEGRHPLLYLLVVLAISTGMRKGELLNLRWQDVKFSKNVLVVEDSKNGDKRSVPLTGLAHKVLQEASKIRRLDTDLIFARTDGLAPVELKKHWEAAVEKANLVDFHFHDLRHTAATYLLESGVTLPVLSAILGHRSIQMVKRYAHLADNHAVEVVSKMTKRVFG